MQRSRAVLAAALIDVSVAVAMGVVATAAGCAAVVTEPNPPGPPLARAAPYAGRIVLIAPAMRDDVERFETPWARRLSILGIDTRIVFDDARAVFDVYGAPPLLSGLAGVLTDPGGWRLFGDSLDSGFVSDWLPATPSCDCAGQMTLQVDWSVSCHWASADRIEIGRPGSAAHLARLKVTWRLVAQEGVRSGEVSEADHRFQVKCPDEQVPTVRVQLLAGTSVQEATAIALALGGGRLPEIPRVESMAPAAGRGPRP